MKVEVTHVLPAGDEFILQTNVVIARRGETEQKVEATLVKKDVSVDVAIARVTLPDRQTDSILTQTAKFQILILKAGKPTNQK